MRHPKSYVVLSVNLLQNKVNSTYDHYFAKFMFVTYGIFKIIINIIKKRY